MTPLPGLVGSGPGPTSLLVTLDALAREAWGLEMPFPHERRTVLGYEAGMLVDGLLARVARGAGALDVAIGEGLAALAVGDRVLRLGYSGIGDYARERLGIAGRTAQALARLARELRTRPLLREAVRRGEVSTRKAQAVLPAAVGAAEAEWVGRARAETVRALEEAVRRVLGAASDGAGARAVGEAAVPESAAERRVAGPGNIPDDEPWEHLSVPMSPQSRRKVDEAMELAGRLLGPASPRWQRVEAICQEYLGAHPAPVEEGLDGGSGAAGDSTGRWVPAEGDLDPGCWGTAAVVPRGSLALVVDDVRADEVCRGANGACCGVFGRPDPPGLDGLESLKVQLEEETGRWATLMAVDPVPAPDGTFGEEVGDPHRLAARLERLMEMRGRWDELVGHLAMLMQGLGLWRHIGFATFGQYCDERLGMAQRTVEQRAWLERRLQGLPALRRAMREGRVSYEKARAVAGRADEGSEAAWIEVAERSTCIALQRQAEADDETQVCARGDVALRLPGRVATLLEAAIRAARRVAGLVDERWLDPGRCLERVAAHFVETWGAVLKARPTPQRRAVERDGGLCQVPGCSRAAAHAHHVRFRSAGGTDEAGNLVALCAAHHLHDVHRGWVRVRGRAPDALAWELGETPADA
jgi:hypothetical protein